MYADIDWRTGIKF